jgi:hypothetical protein
MRATRTSAHAARAAMPAARHTCPAPTPATLRTRATAHAARGTGRSTDTTHATPRARAAHATSATADAGNAPNAGMHATRTARATTRAGTAAVRAAPATTGPIGVGRVVVPRVLFERVTPASGQSKQQDQSAAFEDRRGTASGVHWFSAVRESIFRAISSIFNRVDELGPPRVSLVHQNDGGAIQFE